jgi:flagellar hook-basal body complex protein FliE
MKRLASATVLSVLAILPAAAQYTATRKTPDPQASRFELPKGSDTALSRAKSRLTPRGAQWVAMETQRVRSGAVAPSQVSLDAPAVSGGLIPGADVAELAFIVLMEATNAQDQDLQQIMAQTQSINNQKAAARQQMQAAQQGASGQKDSLADMSEMQQMRLQMAMDRRSKLIEALSNIMKKLNDIGDSIVQNMK